MSFFSVSIILGLVNIVFAITPIKLPQSTDKFKNCLHVEKGNCYQCSALHFLFTLPRDNENLGLKAGTRVCVKCPYFGYLDENNLYCGDCIDNSQTWDQRRLCTYDYKTKSSQAKSIFHKVDRPAKQLFYIVQSGADDFNSIMCDGCSNFCKSKSQTCFAVSQQFQYDLNNPYISCAQGYAFNDAIEGCDSCPDNCQSCQINVVRSMDSLGKITVTTKKKCLICNAGFSLLSIRTKSNKNVMQTLCMACFTGCSECYYGKNQVNLNQDPWDVYNNFELTISDQALLDQLYIDDPENNPPNQIFFDTLWERYQIGQRCSVCTSTSQSTFIPSLNRFSCIRCGTNCRKCEYVSYTLTEDQYPTRFKNIVIEPDGTNPSVTDIESAEASYIFRCRECDDYTQTFLATGTGCMDCSNLLNCKLCHKQGNPTQGGDASFSTLLPDFTPLDKEELSTQRCLICEDGYFLNKDKICEIQSLLNVAPTGCLAYETDTNNLLIKHCRKCNTGYTLMKDEADGTWKCTFDCQQEIQDFLCQSCVKQGSKFRCLKCLDGYYVDAKDGTCQPCSDNNNCKNCYKLSFKSIHRTDYYLYEYDGDTQTYGPYCYACTAGDNKIGPKFNEDLRICEKGEIYCEDFQAKGTKGYCDLCISGTLEEPELFKTSRSASLDGANCIVCPAYTIGCRERDQSELMVANKYFAPTEEGLIQFSYLAYKCDSTVSYLDTNIGRCQTPKDGAYLNYDTIVIQADCIQNMPHINSIWRFNSQYTDITQKTATLILENVNSTPLIDATKLKEYNTKSLSKIIIELQFKYNPDQNNNICYFQRDTFISTNLRKNIFALKDLELVISVSGASPGQRIQWYIMNTIYFEYFTSVTIKDIEILPATDLNTLGLYNNVERYDKPFGFEFLKNEGSKFQLENVKINNGQAESHYNSLAYTTPYSDTAQSLKKYKPFFTILLNTYSISLKNVIFQSQNYLMGPDLSYQAKPFGLVYENNLTFQYLNIRLEDVRFYDFAVEDQAIFELLDMTLVTAPEWNSKIYVKNVQFKDCYFINDGAFLSTKLTEKSTGMIIIDNLQMDNIEYNNSRGIIDFQTMQKVKINGFSMINSRVNYTTLFHITTIDMSKVYLYNTTFTYFGKMVQTQFDIFTIKPNDVEYSGMSLSFNDLEFNQITCLYPACIMLLSGIKNDYELPINISMSNIIVQQIKSDGFNETIWEAATSAAIQIYKSHILQVQNFQSIQNPDLTIFYTEQVEDITFINLKCRQNIDLSIRNNYCVFLNNFYRRIKMIDVELTNLNGIDNSFIGLSSWNNLVYNTSSEDFNEEIQLENVIVQYCTITTTVLAVPSSAILIDSTQEQVVIMKNMNFQNNKHFSASYLKGTLRPSNPTFLIRSVVGTLNLQNSYWKNNQVSGYGAVLYLECGIQIIKNISMLNSNYDASTFINQNQLSQQINDLVEGGHLFLAGYNIQLLDSQFTNSTGKVGGGIYVKTQKEGQVYFNNTMISNALTPMNGGVVSRGGCIYVDSTYSQLNMLLENMELKGCIARADGGGIYVIASDRQQQFTMRSSIISNCYGLSGTSIKVKFDERTQAIQKTTLIGLKISGNYTNAIDYFSNLTNFQIIEEFMLIKRLAAFEQDNGQVEIQNCYSEGLYYYGFISLQNPNLVRFNTIESQHSILSYRPYIEVIEPLANPIFIDSVQFRNISSMNVTVICNQEQLTNQQNAICKILQSRVDFPEYIINPAMMLIDQITKNTPLLMRNIFINRVRCKECYGGLVQVMRVSNSELRELVQLSVCRCSNTEAAYYGCYMVSAAQHSNILTKEDSQIGITFSSSLSLESILKNTGLKSRRRILQAQYSPSDYSYAVPIPTYVAHIIVDSLNIQDVRAIHGGGISIYGLTTNITSAYCTQSVVIGQGGCIYYEAQEKNKKVVYQRLNIASSVFFRNNASIGGAIRVKQSGINDWTKTLNTMLQNYALLYGNDVAGYPTHLGIIVNGKLQHSSYINDNTEWLHYPLVIKSGQEMQGFENQSVLLVFLNENNEAMKYQFESQSNISANLTNTIQGESLRIFNLDKQGFVYSNLQILFDPYQNITLDVQINSSLVNIPRYYSQYPYQLIGFDTDYILQARIRSVECDRGEAYNPQQGSCTPCPIGQYVLVYKGICKQIDDTSMNYTRMNQISIKNQFWRPDHLNDLPEKCKNKPVNCFGGFNVGNDLCYEGMIGALCEECDIYGTFWGAKYSNSAKYECGTCQDRTRNIIMIVILSIFTLYSTISSVKANQERMENCVLYDIFALLGWASSQKASGNVAVLMKIFNNHTQILSILSGFQIEIPNETVDSVNTVSMPAKTIGNSLDCFLVENTWGIDLIYFRLIWSLIMQVIYILMMLIIIFVSVAIGKMQFKVQYLYTMAIYLFVFLQPNYVMEFMTLISSREISGNYYIMANVSYRYDTFKHDQWIAGFGVPGLLLWVLVLPTAFWYVCYQGAQQMKLNSFRFSQSWGFFYHEYRRDRYYWEFIKIFYRSLISILICYFQEEIIVKGILSFLVVYAYYGLSTHFNPYNLRVINDLDQLSTVVLSLSLIVGVFLYRTIDIDFYGLTYAGYVLISILNAIFLLLFFYNLFKGKLQEFAPKLDDVREKIKEKFPHLNNNPRLRPYLQNQTQLNHKARQTWVELSKIVNNGITLWRADKSKPLQFFRVTETPKSDYNTKINQIHQEFGSESDDQNLLYGDGLHSIQMSKENIQDEGKEKYIYH
ncbi:unnamed protein product [Paramecium pentaurelia]|uniref:Uncharacterized protein n=1 Tax=Paramecium pentaurelia TaxID=43138 RepID=A0A8S1XGJ5_9CILI|nr:unnamed protein product [Paramecium pentaurelia]